MLASVSLKNRSSELAVVAWGARFEKTGDRVIEFEISYLLEKAEDEWRILSYISRSHQNAEMSK